MTSLSLTTFSHFFTSRLHDSQKWPPITAAAVKKLRDRTDLPMMNCKKALVEADGDEEKAIAHLAENVEGEARQAGGQRHRRGQDLSVGRRRPFRRGDGRDSVRERPRLQKRGLHARSANDLLKQLAEGPGAATVDELLDQQSPSAGKSLREQHEEISSKILEKIVVARVCRLSGPVAGYVHHDGKTAVLFQADGEKADSQTMRDVAMHIAALRPKVTVAEDLDAARDSRRSATA